MTLKNISVVIPTLNCRRLLEPVIDELRETLRNVGEVIVVDSFSEDGTLELLRSRLDLPAIRFFSHPPGLYDSWNFGISQATCEYLNMATAGDVISEEDLAYLLSVAKTSGVDVVTAPPHFVDEEGVELPDPEWPILELLSNHAEEEVISLSEIDLISFALYHCGPPRRFKSWLGSSASNLYRTSTLKKLPFPVNAGPSGDAQWGLENAGRVSAAFCRRRCGRFVMHTNRHPMSLAQKSRLQQIFEEPWARALTLVMEKIADGQRVPEFLRLIGSLVIAHSIDAGKSVKLKRRNAELKHYKEYVRNVRKRIPTSLHRLLLPPFEPFDKDL